MMSLLGVAERGGGRREVLAEMLRAWRGAGVYADSREELTPLDQDPLSLVPCAAVAGRLLFHPAQAESIIRGAVSSYSLDEEAVCRVLDLPGDCLAGRLAAITDLDGVRS
jgi:hypothetical protein